MAVFSFLGPCPPFSLSSSDDPVANPTETLRVSSFKPYCNITTLSQGCHWKGFWQGGKMTWVTSIAWSPFQLCGLRFFCWLCVKDADSSFHTDGLISTCWLNTPLGQASSIKQERTKLCVCMHRQEHTCTHALYIWRPGNWGSTNHFPICFINMKSNLQQMLNVRLAGLFYKPTDWSNLLLPRPQSILHIKLNIFPWSLPLESGRSQLHVRSAVGMGSLREVCSVGCNPQSMKSFFYWGMT